MIVTVTLNPAMDRLLFVEGFTFNISNRIYRRENCVGGKGTHVSANLACLGEKSIATGIAMGPTGRQILKSLKDLGVVCDFIYSKHGDSRTNYILVDGKSSTLICEKGPDVPESILDDFSRKYDQLTDKADFVVISGDASNFKYGAGLSLQDKLLETAHAKGVKTVLDSAGVSLRTGVRNHPYLIKPNAEELAELTGLPTDTEKEIIEAIKSLSAYGIKIIAVSRGSRGSIVKFKESYYNVGIAPVQAQNTVGCGDAYLSGLIFAIKSGYTPERALLLAAASGSAAALNPLSVGFEKDKALELCDNIEIAQLEN